MIELHRFFDYDNDYDNDNDNDNDHDHDHDHDCELFLVGLLTRPRESPRRTSGSAPAPSARAR